MSNSAPFPVVLLLILSVAVPLVVRADDAYNRGMEAYQADNYPQALRQWKPLAEHGHAQAAYNLGFMYEFGYGVAASDVAAFNYYLRAAQQGHSQAQHTVAWMYEHGKGVMVDRMEAARWADISADSRNEAHAMDYRQEFMNQLASEFKKAGARYEAQKTMPRNSPMELEASNQTS